MTHATASALATLLVCVVCASPARAQRADTAYARVTYVSGASVYVDAGQQDGLRDSAIVEAVRAGRAVASLRVRFLSSHRAQCEVVTSTAEIAVGDSVRFMRTSLRDTVRAATPVPATPSRPQSQRSGTERLPLRGRVGVRYLAMWQHDSGSAQLTQPSTDVRLDGAVPGTALEITLDARGRRTTSRAADGVMAPGKTSTLVYQASVAAPLPGRSRLRVGRQYSGEVSSVSLFDGAQLDLERRSYGVGIFGGTQPDDVTMGLSSDLVQYGAYGALRGSTPDAGRVWSMSTGAVGTYDRGHVDREFAFTAASWNDRRVAFYVLQEIDYNRGWKRSTGASTLSPTSTYASLRVALAPALSIYSGYDTRRAVPLYRNYITPEITFDDTFRTGIWGGLLGQIPGYGVVTVDGRHSYGGPAGVADIYTIAGVLHQRAFLPVELGLRTSRFATPAASGWMQAFSMTASPLTALSLTATGGARFDSPRAGTAAAAIASSLSVRWVELDADIAMGRAWYVLLSATMERGGWEGNDQVYTALSYRF